MRHINEQFEVLDASGHKTGLILNRGVPLEDGEYMGIVTIIVVNKKGEFLVTKRHPNKEPGLMWEVTGGGIKAYETPLAAARRELKEETGLDVNEDSLIALPIVLKDLFYCYQYIVFLDEDKKLMLEEDEVIDYKYLNKDDFFKFIKNSNFISYICARIEGIKEDILKLYKEREDKFEKNI